MNWLTLLLAAVLALLTYRAWANGFVRELVSLSAVILAVPLAGVFYDDLYPKVEPIVDSERAANLISFLAIMFGVIIAGQVAAHLLKRMVTMLNLGGLDKVAGAAFGFFKGVLICQAVLVALVVFPKPDVRDAIDDSVLATKLLDAAPLVLSILPARFDRGLDLFREALPAGAPAPGTPSSTPTTAP